MDESTASSASAAERDEEDTRTPEERMAWLRSKGIQIDIPGETVEVDAASLASITVVRIPADKKQPMEELDVLIDMSSQGDQLIKALKPWFSASADGNTELDMEKMKETMSKHLSASMDASAVSDSVFQKMLSEGNVEAFSLDKPCDANRWESTTLYLDEASQLKNLPSNPRATQVAAQCGYLNVPLSGEIFIGRTKVNRTSGPHGGSLVNKSFNLKEVDSSSSWMKSAESRNYAASASTGQIDMSGAAAQAGEQEQSSGADWDERGVKWMETPSTADVTFSLYAHSQLNYADGEGLTVKQFKAQCAVKFALRKVTIVSKNGATTYLEVPLNGDVDLEESTYTLSTGDEGACEVEISLEKCQEGMWGSL